MTTLAITGGTVLNTRTRTAEPADLLLVDGRVADTGGRSRPALPRLDASGLLVAPGLVDLQVNGARGVDITAEPERIGAVSRALLRHGVTGYLPTVITGPPDRSRRALAALGAPAADGARPLGLHLEGPMIAATHRGAHPEEYLRAPRADLIEGWSAASGVTVVTIAPELPGAIEVIAELTARGVVVSVGHTAASLGQVEAAVSAGARAVTHLFNAMPPLRHRDPGPVGAALGRTDLVAGLIVDGLHVHPTVVAAAWRALGRRLVLVSDTTAALDLPPGRTWLGTREVVIEAGAVRLAADPEVLAGSAVGLDDCVRLLVTFTGCEPVEAVAAATLTPALLLGLADRGHLSAGARADAVLFDGGLSVVATVVGGRLAYCRPGAETRLTTPKED